jgi:hypothetical protein
VFSAIYRWTVVVIVLHERNVVMFIWYQTVSRPGESQTITNDVETWNFNNYFLLFGRAEVC